MPEHRTIPGRWVVSAMALLALIPVVIFFPAPGRTVDGRTSVWLRVPASLAADVAEIRYWPFGEVPGNDVEDDDRETATVAQRKDGDFECYLPYSYDEYGWYWKRRVDTVPLAGQFTIWILRVDGKWSRQTVATPAPDARGCREVVLTLVP